jgi:hypothetical protein
MDTSSSGLQFLASCNGRNIRRLCPAALLLFVSTGVGEAQNRMFRIFLTADPSAQNGVSSSEVGKSLDSSCPDVIITADRKKADYLLEAIDTGAGKLRKPYKFTLFNPDGDRVFSTETAALSNAVKDVCHAINGPSKKK